MTRVIAPAKLTVSLAVTGIRPDGLHELRAEMVALSLADELIITTITHDHADRVHSYQLLAEEWKQR